MQIVKFLHQDSEDWKCEEGFPGFERLWVEQMSSDCMSEMLWTVVKLFAMSDDVVQWDWPAPDSVLFAYWTTNVQVVNILQYESEFVWSCFQQVQFIMCLAFQVGQQWMLFFKDGVWLLIAFQSV